MDFNDFSTNFCSLHFLAKTENVVKTISGNHFSVKFSGTPMSRPSQTVALTNGFRCILKKVCFSLEGEAHFQNTSILVMLNALFSEPGGALKKVPETLVKPRNFGKCASGEDEEHGFVKMYLKPLVRTMFCCDDSKTPIFYSVSHTPPIDDLLRGSPTPVANGFNT